MKRKYNKPVTFHVSKWIPRANRSTRKWFGWHYFHRLMRADRFTKHYNSR